MFADTHSTTASARRPITGVTMIPNARGGRQTEAEGLAPALTRQELDEQGSLDRDRGTMCLRQPVFRLLLFAGLPVCRSAGCRRRRLKTTLDKARRAVD